MFCINLLADVDFAEACSASKEAAANGILYAVVRVSKSLKIKMDGNKNHKRPHVHIE